MIWIIGRLSCVELIRMNCFCNRWFKLYWFHSWEPVRDLTRWLFFFYQTWRGTVLILHLRCDAHTCGLCSVRIVVHLLWLIAVPKLKQGIFIYSIIIIGFLKGAADAAINSYVLHLWWIIRPIAWRNRPDVKVKIFVIRLPCGVINRTVECNASAASPRHPWTSSFINLSRRIRRPLLATYLERHWIEWFDCYSVLLNLCKRRTTSISRRLLIWVYNDPVRSLK